MSVLLAVRQMYNSNRENKNVYAKLFLFISLTMIGCHKQIRYEGGHIELTQNEKEKRHCKKIQDICLDEIIAMKY